MPDNPAAPLDAESCRKFINDRVFQLRPSSCPQSYANWPGYVGLELETLVVKNPNTGNLIPDPISLINGGFLARMEEMALDRGWFPMRESIAGTDRLLRIAVDELDTISFEPGGQVEVSCRPFPCLDDALKKMAQIQKSLDTLWPKWGVSQYQLGINPWHSVERIGLQMAKKRYIAMDRHFAAISEYGQRMMRQTCTLQVNLDFGPTDQVMADRFFAGQLLAPIAGAIFAYSPILDSKTGPWLNTRAQIWQNADPSRTGFPNLKKLQNSRTRDNCVESFFDFAMAASVVYIKGLDYERPSPTLKFGDWLRNPYKGASPTFKDFEEHLTLLFPEVRPRGFIEFRSIDAQSRAWLSVPAAVYCGWFYNNRALAEIIELLNPYVDQLHDLWAKSRFGLQDPLLAKLAKEAVKIGMTGFSALPECFRGTSTTRELEQFFTTFVDQKRTPADALIEAWNEYGPGPAALKHLDDKWMKLVR